MINILAVYQDGVLRPTEPLDLAEGQSVSISIKLSPPPLPADQWETRIHSAKTIQEWVALANACPNEEPDHDVVAAMNETRRDNGERLLIPDEEGASR